MKSELQQTCERLGIRVASATEGAAEPRDPSDKWQCRGYRMVLRYGHATSARLACDFYVGLDHKGPPSAADVLASLCLDARVGESSFEDYCSEFGLNPDSRKVHAVWESCRKMAPRVRAFCGDHFDAIASAEH